MFEHFPVLRRVSSSAIMPLTPVQILAGRCEYQPENSLILVMSRTRETHFSTRIVSRLKSENNFLLTFVL